MALKFKDASGVLRTIASLKVRDGSGLKLARSLKLMDADGVTLRTVATFVPPLTATASPGFGYGSSATIVSDPVTVTPSGGSAPYTYAWTIIAGTATINQPTKATTEFTQTGVPVESTVDATARCTVTDASGQTATVDVLVSFTRDSGQFPQN